MLVKTWILLAHWRTQLFHSVCVRTGDLSGASVSILAEMSPVNAGVVEDLLKSVRVRASISLWAVGATTNLALLTENRVVLQFCVILVERRSS